MLFSCHIKELGYIDIDIRDIGEGYLVDGDLYFDKDFRPDLSDSEGPHSEQYSTGNLVGYNKQSNIVLYIDPSLASHRAEVEGGTAIWNNVPNCRINITVTSSATAYHIRIQVKDTLY